jgi:diguanylate cyclase (GGDEF)-like protein/PAS domain S-box-containing protein
MKLFRDQAIQFEFNEKDYLDAIKSIRVVDKKRIEDLMGVMVDMAKMLAAGGLARLRQAALERDINAHAERNIQLNDILDFSPVAMGWSEDETRIDYVNHQFTQLFGYTLDDLPDLENWYRLAYPDENYYRLIVAPWREAVALAHQDITPPPKLEADITCKDGSVRSIIVHVAWVSHRRLVSFTDITERKRTEEALRASEIKLQGLYAMSPVGIALTSMEGLYLEFNEAFQKICGYTKDELNQLDYWALTPREYANQEAVQLESLNTRGYYGPYEKEYIQKSGHRIPLRLNGVLIHDQAGTPCIWSIVEDITEHKRNEQRMQAHDSMLEMVARGAELTDILNKLVLHMESEDPTSRCSIMLVDEAEKHLLVAAAPSLPAFFNEAAHGIEIGIGIGSCGTAAALGKRVIVENIQSHEYWQVARQLAQQAGLHTCWSEPILSSNQKVLGTFAIYHTELKNPQLEDIERITFAANLAAIAIENRQVRNELERQAHSDYLTGLNNRRRFLQRAESELTRTLRYERELSLIMFDIDCFKQINDTYGHKVGDLVLQHLAGICRASLRHIDIIGRIGGEEFAILLPESGLEQSMDAAERLRAELAGAQVNLDSGMPLHFTASFGVVTLSDQETNIDMLLNQADQALYRAKNEGRNRVCCYQSDNKNY